MTLQWVREGERERESLGSKACSTVRTLVLLFSPTLSLSHVVLHVFIPSATKGLNKVKQKVKHTWMQFFLLSFQPYETGLFQERPNYLRSWNILLTATISCITGWYSQTCGQMRLYFKMFYGGKIEAMLSHWTQINRAVRFLSTSAEWRFILVSVLSILTQSLSSSSSSSLPLCSCFFPILHILFLCFVFPVHSKIIFSLSSSSYHLYSIYHISSHVFSHTTLLLSFPSSGMLS